MTKERVSTLALLLPLLAPLLAGGCAADSSEASVPFEDRVELDSPALPGSGEPNLFSAADGRVYLSWFERRASGDHRLRFSTLEPAGGSAASPAWSEPRTIAEGEDFWVNWADFPSMYALPGGLLAAHWPARSGEGTYDYDVVVAWSEDGGESWGRPMVPHRDGTNSEHGFVSFFPVGEGELGAVWLDGRHFAGWDEEAGSVIHEGRPPDPEMTLRFTTLTPSGLGPEELVDGRICDCCQTSAAVTDEGPIVVYRDRSPDEVRDISIVRRVNGSWSEPAPVHDDGWVIPACPVNGPMVAAEGSRAVTAWFTAAGDEPRVRVAFSDDSGRSFGPPARVDLGDPAGRVSVVLLPGGDALVGWIERIGDGAEILVRRVAATGEVGPPVAVAGSSAARSSGFPRMALSGEHLVFAWTDPGDGEGEVRRVRTAIARVPGAVVAGGAP